MIAPSTVALSNHAATARCGLLINGGQLSTGLNKQISEHVPHSRIFQEMIFVIISSNHNLSATLLLQPFPPSSSPSSRLRCGVVCPLVVCRELTAAKAARCLNPPRAHHVGDWKQEMPSCFVFSGSTNRRSGSAIFLINC